MQPDWSKELHISNTFNCFSASFNGMWNARKLSGKYKTFEFTPTQTSICKYRVDQQLIALNIYSISIIEILVKELMTAEVSQNLILMQQIST